MKTPTPAGSCLALVLIACLLSPVALAQEPAQEPQVPATPAPLMSEGAAEALDQALGGVTHDDFALSFRAYHFPALQGGTLTMIGFELGTSGLLYGADTSDAGGAAAAMAPVEVAQLELFGAVLQGGAELAQFGDEFTLPRGGAELSPVMSFGEVRQAGTYELVWGVRDTISGATASRRDTIEVPALAGAGLTTSSVLMVAGPASPATGQFRPNQVYEGVRVLTVAFPDDLDRVLPADMGSIMVTYIVAGARTAGGGQGINVELGYRILAEGQEEPIWTAEPQTLNRPTVGQEIPLAQIEGLEPGGAYTFEIIVKDLAGGTETTTAVPFRIAG